MSLPDKLRPGRRVTTLFAVAAVITAPLLGVAVTASASQAPGGPNETRPYQPGDDAQAPDAHAPKSNKASRVPAKDVPRVNGLPVAGATGVSTHIDGLTMKDQRDSYGGNSFSLEPPDQGLCTGGGYVIESVNNVFSIYTNSGAQVAGPQSFDPFWNNGTPEIVRHSDGTATYGPFVSDPKCYYDPGTKRFFMTELQLTTDPSTGDFTGDSYENIAVSKTSTPTTSAGDWYLYKLDVRNDGTPSPLASPGGQSTVTHDGCPCLGDQPLIGADRYGFYLTTNEFSISGSQFNGAQIYAFGKAALENGTMKVQRIENNGPAGLPLAEGTAYSVQPATSPTASDWSSASRGTEFFLSSLEFTGGFDNRIATWALTNTRSLATGSPNAHLSNDVVPSEVYGSVPEGVAQKSGPTPLADAVNAKEELIAANDDRMNQVVYADGRLWSGVNTAVKTNKGPTTVGIAYFVVTPGTNGDQVVGSMDRQGYVAVDGNSVIFPSIGVNPGGGGVMTFTLTGADYYPSAAIVHLDAGGTPPAQVQVLAAGAKADDGFSGYAAYGGDGVGRWGDYSAAVADASGNIWVATEYIPGTYGYDPVHPSTPPSYIANWGTYVAQVTP